MITLLSFSYLNVHFPSKKFYRETVGKKLGLGMY